jgi:diguanylate cyclase (GGDEF)-like protein
VKRPVIWLSRSGLPTGKAGKELASLGYPLHWERPTLESAKRVIELKPIVVVIETNGRSGVPNRLLGLLEKLRESQEFFVFLLLDREPKRKLANVDAFLVNGRGLGAQFEISLRAVSGIQNRAQLEIARLKRRGEKLQNLVVRDDLTSLFNLRFFNSTLENEHSRALRFRREYALIFIDLDGLKEVNNRFGHLVGGRVLQQVGDFIGQKIRGIDVPARVGGDEFVIICPETPKMSARLVAERIRQGIEELNSQENGPPQEITVSMGVASYPDDGDTPEQVLDRADRALFEAKARGKNRVCCWGEFPMDRKEFRGTIQGRRSEDLTPPKEEEEVETK